MRASKFIVLLFLFSIVIAAAGKDSYLPAALVNDSLFSESLDKKTIRRKKVISIGLAVALGPFGVHRLYLGTDPKIPVIYSITLGAFGLLPLADIIAILATKELEHYLDNRKIIMWLK